MDASALAGAFYIGSEKMYLLKTTAAFDSAHFLSGYSGKCSNIHGHRWTVEACVYSEELISEGEKRGMIIDFGDLKREVRSLAESFDHALIIEEKSLMPATMKALNDEGFRVIEVPFRPTAENFAHYFFVALRERGLPVKSAAVFETPENCAVYEEEPCRR